MLSGSPRSCWRACRRPVGPGDRRIGSSGCSLPATPVKEAIHHLHNELLVIIFAISAFVLALLLYVIVRFRASRNPVPSRTAHNTVIEVLWTVVPVLILVIIAIPSFRLMYFMDRVPDAEMTIKVVGNQWFWTYSYPDQGDFSFASNIIPEKELKPDQKRLLDVDNPLVVPVDTNIRVLIGGVDVMHSWYRSGLRHPVLRNARPRQRDLDAGRVSGHLLRRMQPDLRHQSRLHADQGGGGFKTRVRDSGSPRRSRNSPRRTPAAEIP